MANSMWVRCPECGNWCYAEKKDMVGRMFRSIEKTNEQSVKFGGAIGEFFDMKSLGETVAHADILNPLNIPMHVGEMFMGKKILFRCTDCGEEFGTDDEDDDKTEEHGLYMEAVKLSEQFSLMKNGSAQDKADFIRNTQEILAAIENTSGIDDAKVVMYDVLACCYYFFYNDSQNALLEINKSLDLQKALPEKYKSLDLFDDNKSHVLKGLFMGKEVSPINNYAKMKELLRIYDCESDIQYVDRRTIIEELEQAERNYVSNFISIPENQRKFLVITSDYKSLPDNCKVIKYNSTNLSGVKFDNGFANNNAIYVCHPYKPNVYFPSESYQTSLFEDQLCEFRELLQCLGAKSIKTENLLSSKGSYDKSGNLSGKVGGEYKGIGGNLSGEYKTSDSVMESKVQKMLIEDEFSFDPNMPPFVPEGLAWYNHMEEWQRLSRMRQRGQNKYSINISSSHTHIVNENEAKLVNAEFNALVAKANLEIAQSTELKASEDNSHEWKLVVEFYPLSEYNPQPTVENVQVQRALPQKNNESALEPKKKNLVLFILFAVIALLLIIIGIMLF